MIKGYREPCIGSVAVIAGGSAWNVIWCFARCPGAVVTAEAGTSCDAGMIKGRRGPGTGGVAVIAGGAAGDMVGCLAGGDGAVVAGKTGAGSDIGMIKVCPLPRTGGVAVITAIAAGNVIRRLACCCYAIVATETGTHNYIVVHAYKWFPELICMTFLTQREHLDMVSRYLVAAHHACLAMAGRAGKRCSFKHAAQVTTCANSCFMSTLKREAG